jgi:hypothetical protein
MRGMEHGRTDIRYHPALSPVESMGACILASARLADTNSGVPLLPAMGMFWLISMCLQVAVQCSAHSRHQELPTWIRVRFIVRRVPDLRTHARQPTKLQR